MSVEERYEYGKQLRKQVPRSTHGHFSRPPHVDPAALLLGEDDGRIEPLIPMRHELMTENMVVFHRAGAGLMAADLAGTPTTNLMVQASGDAHLSNFGFYGSPERSLVFDASDFDQTLPASFEWDVKRLAASFVIAAIDNGFDPHDQERVALHCVREYRDAMLQFASQGLLHVWFSHISAGRLLDRLRDGGDDEGGERNGSTMGAARREDGRRVLGKLTEKVDGRYRIVDDHPMVAPLRSMGSRDEADRLAHAVGDGFSSYVETLPPHVAVLARRYRWSDVVVGPVDVGSIGARSFIVLLEGRDEEDILFLRCREAGRSVLSDRFGESAYEHMGERVVRGQKLMQTDRDIFLGWFSDTEGRHYYMRQLRDAKASLDVSTMGPKRLRRYATACAWTLAQSHARSGDAVVLTGYMGSGDVFAEAVAEFASAYATQNEADHRAFLAATATGRTRDSGRID